MDPNQPINQPPQPTPPIPPMPEQPLSPSQQNQPVQQATPGQVTPAAATSQQGFNPGVVPSSSSINAPTPSVQPLSKQSSGSKAKVIIIIVIVIAVLGVGGVVAFLLMRNTGGSNPVSSITNTISGGNKEVIDRKDGTLDLGTLIDKQETIKNQDIKAGLNQQVNLSDGMSYMVTAVERNFSSQSRSLRVRDGKELIKISVVVGNKNKEGEAFINGAFFKLRNSAGGLLNTEFVSETDMPDALKSQSIAPGKQVKGSIIFEVDKGEAVSALVTEDQYENFSTKEKVTIKSEVALQ